MNQNLSAVARRYSKALWMASSDVQLAKNWLNQLRIFEKMLKEVPDFQRAMLGFEMNVGYKIELLKSVLEKAGSSQPINRFLIALTRAGRIGAFSEVLNAFERIIHSKENLISCQIESAFPLEDYQKKEIEKKLEKILRGQIKIVVELRPNLIAGFRVKVTGANGDVIKVIDVSFVSALQDLKTNLLEERLLQTPVA